jgi:hypothetical protein
MYALFISVSLFCPAPAKANSLMSQAKDSPARPAAQSVRDFRASI